MALIDKASLLMVPSTYEAGKLYNVLPSGNRAPDSTDQNSGYDQTRADFDFDRGTDHAATRIGSDGLLKKYRENLLTFSNDFSNAAWTKVNATVTSGQSDKDGGTNAWKINSSASGSSQIFMSGSNTNMKTHSIYAKAGSVDVLKIWVGSNKEFNLSNGTTSSSNSKITDVGNGWYRCEVFDVFSNYNPFFTATTAGEYIYIQSAQLESGLVATDYLDSGATTAKAGVLVDLPRINYDANGENGSLLLEPSRQQLIQFSEYFGGSGWNNFASIAPIANSTISPEGVQNASTLECSGNNVFRYSFTASSSTNYVGSIFVKAKETTNDFGIQTLESGTAYTSFFNIESGVVVTQASNHIASIEDYGNGWFRCSVKFNSGSSTSNIFDFKGSQTTDNKEFYAYGAQIEANASYPSSYIPNHGESGGVTRAADSCSVTGASDVIGQTEGTMYAEFDFQKLITGDTGRIICIGDNTISNRIGVGIGGNGKFEGFVVSSGTLVAYIQTADVVTELKNYKIAMAYKANDFALYINGVQIGTDNGGAVPTGMNKVFVGLFEIGGSGSQPSNPIKQATLFKERLSNAELATLTTL